MEEGAFLYGQGVDPYSGDLYHNSPLALFLTSALIKHIPQWIPPLFIIVDLLAAYFLYATAKSIMRMLLKRQEKEKASYAKDTEEFLLNPFDLDRVPQLALIAYLFNPYSIMNCVGQTMTVWSNFLLAGFLLGMAKGWLIPATLFLAIEVQQNLYPLILVVPLIIGQASTEDRTFKWSKAVVPFVLIAGCIGSVAYLNFMIYHQSWNFIDSTFGFMQVPCH